MRRVMINGTSPHHTTMNEGITLDDVINSALGRGYVLQERTDTFARLFFAANDPMESRTLTYHVVSDERKESR